MAKVTFASAPGSAIPEPGWLPGVVGELSTAYTPRITVEHTSDDVTISATAKDMATLRSALIAMLYLLDGKKI